MLCLTLQTVAFSVSDMGNSSIETSMGVADKTVMAKMSQ